MCRRKLAYPHVRVVNDRAHAEGNRAPVDATAHVAKSNQSEYVPTQVMPDEVSAFKCRLAERPALDQEALGLGEPTSEHDHEGEGLVGNRLRVFARGVDERNLPG